MECTIAYGFSRNSQHRETLPVAEAFRMITRLSGYAFINVYFGDHLVYTTQGLAGYAWICDDCPYSRKGRKLTHEQWKAVHNTREVAING